MAKKKKDINDMSIDELLDSLNDLKKEVFNINIQKLAGQFEDTSQISKKDVQLKDEITQFKKEIETEKKKNFITKKCSICRRI